MARVIVYSTPNCPWCIKAKNFLKENKIKFEEKDVWLDDAAKDEMVRKSGQMGVPVIDIDGTVILGYDIEKIKSALKIKKQTG